MRIAKGARKHGITDEEMLHAIRNHEKKFRQDDSIWLYIGASGRGVRMLEVAVLRTDDGDDVVIHAMPVRFKYWP